MVVMKTQTVTKKKFHMPEPEMPATLVEHIQKMIKPDYLQDKHIAKSDERWCIQCQMMWFLVNTDGTKNFRGKSKICNRCKVQGKCRHKRTELIRAMLECLSCKLRREPAEVRA